MLIALAALLLCSCKQGAWPLHSAYTYYPNTQHKCQAEGWSLSNSIGCSSKPDYIGQDLVPADCTEFQKIQSGGEKNELN